MSDSKEDIVDTNDVSIAQTTDIVYSEDLVEDFQRRYPDLDRALIELEFGKGETWKLGEIAAVRDELYTQLYGKDDDIWFTNFMKCLLAVLLFPLTCVLSFSNALAARYLVLRGMRGLLRYLSPSWLLKINRAVYFLLIVPFSSILFLSAFTVPFIYIYVGPVDKEVTLTEGVYPSMVGVAVFFVLVFLLYEKRSSLYKATHAFVTMHNTFQGDRNEILHASEFFDIVYERDIRAQNNLWARRKFIFALLLPIPSTVAPIIFRAVLHLPMFGVNDQQTMLVIMSMIVNYCCTYFIVLLFGECVRLFNTFYVYTMAFSKWTKRDAAFYATTPSSRHRSKSTTAERLAYSRSYSNARGKQTYFNLIEPSGLLFWSRARHDLQNRQIARSYEMAVFLSFMVVCLAILVITEMVQLYVESDAHGQYRVSSQLFTVMVAYDCLVVGVFMAVLLITGVIINNQTPIVTKALSGLSMDIAWARSGCLPADKIKTAPENLDKISTTLKCLMSLLDREKDEFGLRVLGITINSAFTGIIISVASAALVPFLSNSALKIIEIYG